MVIQYIIHIEIWSEASLHFFNMNLETDFNQLQGNLQNMSIWVSGKGHKQTHWLNMMFILMWMNLAINYNFQTHPYPLFIDKISMVDGENPIALMVLFKNSKVTSAVSTKRSYIIYVSNHQLFFPKSQYFSLHPHCISIFPGWTTQNHSYIASIPK